MTQPADVVTKAYDSLANGRVDDVLDLLDSEQVARVVVARQEMLAGMTRAGRPGSEAFLALLLRTWGLTTADELRSLPAREVMRRSLAACPSLRGEVECVVDEVEEAGPPRATVRCRLAWDGSAPTDVPSFTVELRRTTAGWRIQPVPASPWLLPGFEGLLVSDEE